jgi:hypothetical protein
LTNSIYDLFNGSGSFLPSSLSLLPPPRPCRMSDTPRTGSELLAATKTVLARAQAVRTAEAALKYLVSAETNADCVYPDIDQEGPQSSSSANGELWDRSDSPTSSDIIFTRSNGEILTITKSPGGDKWLIIYDEPDDLPA